MKLIEIREMTNCEFKQFLVSKHQLVSLINLMKDSLQIDRNIKIQDKIIHNWVLADVLRTFNKRYARKLFFELNFNGMHF